MIRSVPGSSLSRRRRRLQLVSKEPARAELDRLREEVRRLTGLEKRFETLVELNVRTQGALDKAVAEREHSSDRLSQWPNRDRELKFLYRQFRSTQRNLYVPTKRQTMNVVAWLRTEKARRKLLPLFDTNWYLSRYPQVPRGDGANPLAHYIRDGAAAGLNPNALFESLWYVARNSGVTAQTALSDYLQNGLSRDPSPLFDTQWYLRSNPQIERFRVNPLAHYLEFWATEGGDPHPLFDTNWYLAQYEDVKQSGVPPLLHYVVTGAAEGRDPNPLFDTDWYLLKNPDVAAACLNPLAHYIQSGAVEGRKPHPLFDGVWYRSTYADVAKAGINPLTHYLLHGAPQRRDPHPLFQSQWYQAQYPEASKTHGNLLVEYLEKGAAKDRNPNPYFDSSWYFKTYPDVVAAGMNPLVHYIEAGEAEGRSPSPRFDPAWYREEYPDIGRAGLSPLTHYLHYGRKERRNPIRTHLSKQQSQEMRTALRLSSGGKFVPSETFHSPLISILLPTYNTPPRYLQDAIQSVRRQTYPHWELCIVDDGSHEHSCLETLRRVEKEDGRVRVCYRARNEGIVAASQQALEMASGEFVAFLDHDDVLAPHALAEVAGFLREDPDVAMVYTDHAMMDEDGKLRSPSLKPGWSREFFLSTNYVVHLKVIRRSVVCDLGGFQDSLDSAQDVSLTCKLAGGGHTVRHLPKVLYYWRVHAGSVASKSSAKPAIESSAIQTYNDFLAQQLVPATLVWPDYFRKARSGAYKLEFANKADRKVAVILPGISHPFSLDVFETHYQKTDFDPIPRVHLVVGEGDRFVARPGIHRHLATTQTAFDEIVERIECDYLVFLSPSAKTLSSAWLKELIGYFSVSPQIGAVGGKILDTSLRVQSGGLLLLNQVTPISRGALDESDGYWFNNRIASNVEAVSSRLLATPKSVYRAMGGVPFFEYGDAAGVPYCLKLREAGYRVVYTPWSKIVDEEDDNSPPGLDVKLEAAFGPEAKRDRYYHPFFSRNVPYMLDPSPADTTVS